LSVGGLIDNNYINRIGYQKMAVQKEEFKMTVLKYITIVIALWNSFWAVISIFGGIFTIISNLTSERNTYPFRSDFKVVDIIRWIMLSIVLWFWIFI